MLSYEFTDNHGCKNKADLLVTVKPEPALVIDPTGSKLCIGNPFTIKATYSFAKGVLWGKSAQSDGNIIGNPTSTSISYNPGTNDISRLYFWLNIRTTHSDSICIPAYDSIKVKMYQKPKSPVISLSPSDSFLECDLKNGAYEWYFRTKKSSAPNAISNNSRRIAPILYCNKCYFNVIYTDSNGCKSDSSLLFNFGSATTVDQSTRSSGFVINPNPAHSELFIENPTNQSCNMLLTDIYGSTVLQKRILPGKTTISLQNFKPGIYFIFIDGNIAGKVVIE